LRVFRFVAKYDFDIDDSILNFVKENINLIKTPSKERINTELMKLFESKYSVKALTQMDKIGLLDVIFPVMKEVKKIPPNTHHHLCLQEHLFETVNQIQKNYEQFSPTRKKILESKELSVYTRLAFLKFAGFMHDIGKPDTWTIDEKTGRHRFITHDDVGSKKIVPIMQDLKFSKKQISYVQKMIKFHIYPSALIKDFDVSEKAICKFYRKMYPYCEDIILLSMADRLSAMGKDVTVEMIVNNLAKLSVLLEKCAQFNDKEVAPKPFLNGNEIMALSGMQQSKELGMLIKDLYNMQLEKEITTKEEAIEYVKKKK
jgi:tRNA nucleotidyltransferase/poly(A) polymerase